MLERKNMIVKELIERLRLFPANAEVILDDGGTPVELDFYKGIPGIDENKVIIRCSGNSY